MTMLSSKKPTVLAAALVLSAGLAAGCVTNHYDQPRYGSSRYEPYYPGYGYGRTYPPSYGHHPHPYPPPHHDESLKHEQAEEQRDLHRDQQDQDRSLERAQRDERHDEKDAGTWNKDDRHEQHQEHRAVEREQKDAREDLHRDQKRERQDERHDDDRD